MKNLIITLLFCLTWQNVKAQNDTIIQLKDNNPLLEKSPTEESFLEQIVNPNSLKKITQILSECGFKMSAQDCKIPLDTIITKTGTTEIYRALKSDFEEGKLLQISLLRETELSFDYDVVLIGFFLINKKDQNDISLCYVELNHGLYMKSSAEKLEDKTLPKRAVEFMLNQIERRQ